MSNTVHTEHGPGKVVETQTVHGRTSHRVEGNGFSIWVDAAQLQFDENPPVVDYDNSTALPYNPRPQFPNEAFEYPILNMGIDPEERLRPVDSLTFEDRPYNSAPGPAPHLFAQGSYGDDPRYAAVEEDLDKDSIIARLRREPERLARELQQAHHAGTPDLEPRVAAYYEATIHDASLKESAWKDVRAKGVRLRNAGNVEPIGVTPESIYAYVMGDNGVYETIVVRGAAMTGNHSISEWDCTCEWGKWAFKRQHTYVGRLCSHAYAAYLEMQSAHQRKDKGKHWYASREASAMGEPVPSDSTEQYEGEDGEPLNVQNIQSGREHHMPPAGLLTLERGSLDFDVNQIPFDPHHFRDQVDNERGLVATGSAAFGIEAALVDIQSVSDPEDQGLLDRLRELSRENQRLQHSDERNRELRKLVRILHERGYNAENLTAAIEVAARAQKKAAGELFEPGPHEPFNGSGPVETEYKTTSETYVEVMERPHHVPLEAPGPNPVVSRNITELKPLKTNAEYIAERLGHAPAATAGLEGDHGFRPSNISDIQAFGSTDPLGADDGGVTPAGGGGIPRAASGPLTEDDPGLAQFLPLTAEAEARVANTDLSHLMGNGGPAPTTASADDGDLSFLMEGVPRTAGRVFSPSEQDGLINEASSDGLPFDQSDLDLTGTHYLG